MKIKAVLREVQFYVLLPFFFAFFALTMLVPLFKGRSGSVLEFSLYILCGVLTFKSMLRLYGYCRVIESHPHVQSQTVPDTTARARGRYVATAVFMWLAAFVAVLAFRRFTFLLVAASWALLALDVIFYSEVCLFQKIGTLLNSKNHIACCRVCPIRGWGLMMLATPLAPAAFIFPSAVVTTLVFCAATFVLWETRAKRAMLPHSVGRNCAKCGHKCGEEYLEIRKCRR